MCWQSSAIHGEGGSASAKAREAVAPRDGWFPGPLPPPIHFYKVSPTRSGLAEIPHVCGHSRANLCTAVSRSEPEILSLGQFLSKPPDFADLVRFL